jgi:hypothetical protein
MLESLTRKEQFRQVWGVSPKSINQKRNLKTLIGAHQISFTEQEDVDCETTISKADKIDYEMFESDDFEKGMFDRENIEKENGGSQEIDVEGLLPLPDLNFSIPTELFSQYIDANFPANEGDNLIISTQFQSIEDVFSSQPLKANVSGNSPCLEPTTSYSDTCPEAVSSEDAGISWFLNLNHTAVTIEYVRYSEFNVVHIFLGVPLIFSLPKTCRIRTNKYWSYLFSDIGPTFNH